MSGVGGYYLYKLISESDSKWSIDGNFNEAQASHIMFHGIFGTYKEDSSILEHILMWEHGLEDRRFEKLLKKRIGSFLHGCTSTCV